MKKDEILMFMKQNNIEFDPKISHSKGLVIATLFRSSMRRRLSTADFCNGPSD